MKKTHKTNEVVFGKGFSKKASDVQIISPLPNSSPEIVLFLQYRKLAHS